MLRQYLKSLADKFRTYLGSEPNDLINAQDFPSAIDDVYEAGKQSVDTTEAFENGKKETWKGISDNGKRTNYTNGFQYSDLAYFYPYSDMRPTHASYMFALTNAGGSIDLVDRLEQCGSTLDFSTCTQMTRTFFMAAFTRIGIVDCTATTALERTLGSAFKLHTIEKMIVKAENTFQNTFESSAELVEIRFEGVIGNNIDFSPCKKLSHDSIINDDGTGIINVLSTLDSGVTRTLALGSTNLAKLTDAEKAIATQKGWTLA
jgi:hypothetical protein